MTSLNKLFSRYFIFTIAIVLILITLISNFGASAFFKNFIDSRNEKQNAKIVNSVQTLLDTDSVSLNTYPFFLSVISRQEQVNLALYYGEELVAITYSGMPKPMGGMGGIGGRIPEEQQIEQKINEDDDIIYLDYSLGLYTLKIGRASNLLFDDANADFIKTLNIMYIAVFALAMAVAVFAAWILSKKFNKPIMQLKSNVNHISMNRFDKMQNCNTKAKELMELSEDIENLAMQMQKEENMRKRLSNDIVHELKTPIAVLSTNIEAILDGVYKADGERMSVLLSQTERLARLVNNLSELTLLETEYENMPMGKVNISELLDSVYTAYLPVATEKNIKLGKDINKNIIINGNEDRLLQVFVNILSNALKYTDGNGEILIKVFLKNNDVICEIEDTGIGIDEKDQPFIFNRFYRGDESRSRETGGSGIGLAIAKAVVSAHAGEIKVESKKGEGTKISIIFPKKQIKNS